jgi:ABC-type multidrug transport system fused ATPase/permease subunit
MRDIPVFDVRGRSLISAAAYLFLCLILFGLFIIVIFLYLRGVISPGSFLFILILLVLAISFMLSVTYILFTKKRFACDGEGIYLYYGKKLVKRFMLSEIREVGSDRYFITLFIPFKAIFIDYKKGNKSKQLYITEDMFPVNDMVFIFRELARYAASHNLIVFDANHWLD